MRRGLRRLFVLGGGAELAFIEYDLPDMDRLSMWYSALAPDRSFSQDLFSAVADRVFLLDQPDVRDAQTFERRMTSGIDQLDGAAKQLHGSLRQTWAVHGRLVDEFAAAPDGWRAAVDEMRVQLDGLIARGFVADTPWFWLNQFPRYLSGMLKRIEKLEQGGSSRDGERSAGLRPYFDRWRTAAEGREPWQLTEAMVHYRWMLEEYRVSLFAQELGTAIAVSPKRLDRQADRAGL
jgi:ATP-dependent helicase HrpA